MNRMIWLALLSGAAIVCQASPTAAQQMPSATGQIVGTVTDSTGALVSGAQVTLTSTSSRHHETQQTTTAGEFRFPRLAAGRYTIAVHAAGFRAATLPSLNVSPGRSTPAEVTLDIAPVQAQIEVDAQQPGQTVSPQNPDQSSGAAGILRNLPGVSLRSNGAFGSIPLLHGMGDERTKILVDGMTVSPSCPNHMNPPLTYLPAADADRITVMAGITPVSEGGDSIGGTISIHSAPPVFAAPGEHLRRQASLSPFYSSNGSGYGGSASAWLAGRSLSLGYNGSFASLGDYTDGRGHTVTSTYGRRIDNAITLAARSGPSLFVLTAGLHTIPFQGFVNARMDMLDNRATRLNFLYRRTLSRSLIDARLYYQNTAHTMNIGRDKARFPMPMFMPMNSHGTDSGYSFRYQLPISSRHTLRVGNELHRFVLNDAWPPVAGQAPMLGPATFISIHNGRRTRLGTFAEAASQWNSHWSTLFGLRNDTIWSDTGTVQGYSMMYAADAAAFNAASRARTDADYDATALARYRPGHIASFEFGYARKSRAPSLYERYAWSTDPMISSMIGWFGDGNDYVGSLSLQPEVAHTLSGTINVHSGALALTAAPYLTWIHNYIDINRFGIIADGMNNFAQLRFANHPARIAGADFSGSAPLWNSIGLGRGSLRFVAGWLQGERTDTHTGLYQMMPLHARIEVDQQTAHWQSGITLRLVDRKSSVDPFRFEQQTPGYALLGLHTALARGPLRLSAAATNLLNRQYQLPLGGVNMDAYLASMSMSRIEQVAGPGRSVEIAGTLRF